MCCAVYMWCMIIMHAMGQKSCRNIVILCGVMLTHSLLMKLFLMGFCFVRRQRCIVIGWFTYCGMAGITYRLCVYAVWCVRHARALEQESACNAASIYKMYIGGLVHCRRSLLLCGACALWTHRAAYNVYKRVWPRPNGRSSSAPCAAAATASSFKLQSFYVSRSRDRDREKKRQRERERIFLPFIRWIPWLFDYRNRRSAHRIYLPSRPMPIASFLLQDFFFLYSAFGFLWLRASPSLGRWPLVKFPLFSGYCLPFSSFTRPIKSLQRHFFYFFWFVHFVDSAFLTCNTEDISHSRLLRSIQQWKSREQLYLPIRKEESGVEWVVMAIRACDSSNL